MKRLPIPSSRYALRGLHRLTFAVMQQYLLRLFVTGKSTRSDRALAQLRALCERDLAGAYRIEVVDVLEHPQLAEEERILATPTVVRQLPPPMRRVIGDLADQEKVIFGLDLRPLAGDAGLPGPASA